jgi:hypothetical protein
MNDIGRATVGSQPGSVSSGLNGEGRTALIFSDGSETEWVIPANWSFLGDKPGFCRSCHATVIWLQSDKSRKFSPFNPDGVNHFASCPDATAWRRR